MRLELALRKPTVGRLALGMANSLTGQGGKINCRTGAADGLREILTVRRAHCHLSCVRLGGKDAHAQLLHKPDRTCCRCAQPRILEVDVLRVRPQGDGKCLREHPEHTHPAHQVAVLKGARVIRGKVVDVQAASDTAANQGAMHRTHHGMRKRAQLHKAVVQLAKAQGEAGQTHHEAAAHGVRVAADGEVRPRPLQHDGGHAGLGADMLHSTTKVLA